MNTEVAKLRKLCNRANVELIERQNGHFQIKGAMLVNYYPTSKKQSAYVAGTTEKLSYISPERAVQIAVGKQEFTLYTKEKRQRSYLDVKIKMLKKCNKCHWCGLVLTIETATLDHRIPLSRGGLNNENNYVLACRDCNADRGNDLPVG